MKNLVIYLATISVVLLFGGCSFKTMATIDKVDNEFVDFAGIEQIYASDEDVVIYYTHGMGTPRSDDKETMQFFDAVAKEAGFPHAMEVNTYTHFANFGDMTVKVYGDENNIRKMYLFSLGWGKHLDFIEMSLQYRGRPFSEFNTKTNNKINNFVDMGLADAVLYLSPEMGERIYETLNEEIEYSYKKFDVANKDKILISTSLGSKVVFDMLKRKEGKASIDDFVETLQQVFMTSNQIPLLDLYSQVKDNTHMTRDAAHRVSPTLSSMAEVYRNKSLVKPIPVIAFSDPADALSYYNCNTISDTFSFVNVTITHAKWRYFFFIANPLEAHGGFKSGDVGYQAIVHGSEVFEFEDYDDPLRCQNNPN